MKLSRKAQEEILKGMKQNNFEALNAGQKREQITSQYASLAQCSKQTKLEIIKKLIDTL